MSIPNRVAFVLAAVLCGMVACGGESRPPAGSGGTTSTGSTDAGLPGSEGNHCYPNSTCNLGLLCRSTLCVKEPGAGGSSNTGGVSSGGVSGKQGGQDANVGTGGDGSGGTDGGGTAVGTLGEPCLPSGSYACAGHGQRGQLVCNGGAWATNGTCSTGNNCDTTPGSNAGFCNPVVAECSGKNSGDVVCRGLDRLACGPDLVTTTAVQMCIGGCVKGACTTCEPAAKGCNGLTPQTCDANGAWTDGTRCQYGCAAGVCTGACTPGAKQCSGNGVQACSASGQWGAAVACAATTPMCTNGSCALPPSCSGLAATCGPSTNESCCTSPLVTGGTFYRSYDGVTTSSPGPFTSQAYPATVSDFRLDTYEITVGRFRKFVAAYTRNMIAAGAGKNPNNASDPGWDTAWNTSLPATAAALGTAVACNATYQTWTPSAGSNENKPMNCIDWYEANAFCIWDGGRLPTEAEWNYAAAGGSEQRVYPWGATTPAYNVNLAVYGCYYGGGSGTCSGVSSIAPVGSVSAGKGKWGQADLAGNVWELTLDWYANPYSQVSCANCANTTSASSRVDRGGSFTDFATSLLSSGRDYGDPLSHSYTVGSRCARTP